MRIASNHDKSFFRSGNVPQLLWEAVEVDQVCTKNGCEPGTLYLASPSSPTERQFTVIHPKPFSRYTVPDTMVITIELDAVKCDQV